MIESTKSIIPVELTNEDLDFIVMYPNIINKLKAGKILYLQGFKGYIGEKGTVGPYCEDEVFNLEYLNLNSDLNELIIGLEKNIEKGNAKIMKLSKLGIYYNE